RAAAGPAGARRARPQRDDAADRRRLRRADAGAGALDRGLRGRRHRRQRDSTGRRGARTRRRAGKARSVRADPQGRHAGGASVGRPAMASVEPAYAETIAWLQGLEVAKGWDLKLDRMRQALAVRGHPERQFRALHVAGTNGKGSTAAMLESILRAAG